MTGTGSDITGSDPKPEVTCFGRRNRGPVGKRDRGLKGKSNRGLKVQSPILATGVVLESKKKTRGCW